MKEYLLIAKGNKQYWDAMSEEEFQPIMNRFSEWITALKEKNLWLRGDSLSGEGRALVKENGQFTDGPFLETKEVFTGFFLIRAEDLSHATELSKGCPILGPDSLQIFELEGDRQ